MKAQVKIQAYFEVVQPIIPFLVQCVSVVMILHLHASRHASGRGVGGCWKQCVSSLSNSHLNLFTMAPIGEMETDVTADRFTASLIA